MDKKTRLLEALSHINSVDKLIIDEDYHGYMSGKLLMVEIELQRQLQKPVSYTHLRAHET